MAGIYIHIPFCKQKCFYCDFYSRITTDEKLYSDYVDALVKEIELRSNYLDEPVKTIYFGGGTPSTLNINLLNKIFDKLENTFDTSQLDEVTFEVNPDDVDEDYIKSLRDKTPINRISIGVQSFSDKDLKFLNRRHNAKQAIEAVEILKKYFDNISLDLIYGIPGSPIKTWKKNLEIFFGLNIPHLSAYHLTIEENTVFGRWKQTGKISEIKEEESVEEFGLLMALTGKNGFMHYEISNFAREGYISKHNFSYWTGEKYLGLGTSAHSYNGTSRLWNIANVTKYIERINKGQLPAESEVLTRKDKFNEYVMTRLRTYLGIDTGFLEKKFNDYYGQIKNTLKEFEKNGFLELKEKNYVLTDKGKFISDKIIEDLFIV